MKHTRHLSGYARTALTTLAAMIRSARIEQRITQQQLAERAGISRSLIAAIERGEAGAAIGTVFEVAAILQVRLFDQDRAGMTATAARMTDRLTLLPGAVQPRRRPLVLDEDF